MNASAGLFRCWALIAVIIYLAHPAEAARISISIEAPATLLASPVAQNAVEDTKSLLRRAMPSAGIGINLGKADVVVIFPNIPPHSASAYAYAEGRLAAPDRSYAWTSARHNGHIVLRLQARSSEGVACGLYGLLQGKLGFRFHHPRESVIPCYTKWPLPAQFSFSGRPRFEKTGFHLHTMHPIELAEQLLDPKYPGAFADVAQYIDWLARNGQNTMQFVLLRGIDRTLWPQHARRIVEYAHSRGIMCGVQISLCMFQQQAFQSLTLLRPFPGYQQQIESTLTWLFQVPWDFVSLEPTMGEHLPFLNKLLPEAQAHFERQVASRKRLLLLGTHVIGGAEAKREPQLAESGVLVHSVMCYSVTDDNAPVYGNRNQCFMLQTAKQEQARRETWYWPESSYWVGFDTPVPLLLLPYLEARQHDIENMAKLGLNGHLTFTSGWEWGYWLIDWSIARWAWVYTDSGKRSRTGPLGPLEEIIPDYRLVPLWREALRLQNHFLKEKELMRFMAASTPFSELPNPFNKPFQPAPEFDYGDLLRSAPQEAHRKLDQPIRDLEEYATKMGGLAQRLDNKLREGNDIQHRLASEMNRGLAVSALRASHRALTLRALVDKVAEASGAEKGKSAELLTQARRVRYKALNLVKQQEQHYRYPLALLAGQRSSITAYSFGYLYPASRLFFWQREEEQIARKRFDPLFMNLWDVRRTLGLESLFFR